MSVRNKAVICLSRDKSTSRSAIVTGSALLVCIHMLTGCTEKKVESAGQAPLEVEVIRVVPRSVPITKEWVAVLKGKVNADVRAQVSGYLLKQTYTNGAFVSKGALLFEIDPRPFQATVDQAQANVEQAKSALNQAKAALEEAKANQKRAEAEFGKTEIDVKRYTPLAKAKAISQEELDNAVQANLAAKAQVEATKAAVETAIANISARSASVAGAQAAMETAELNLGFTRVTSLIRGVAGIANAQVGDLVGPQSTTPLATVSTVDPILAQFSASEQEYLTAASRIGSSTALDAALRALSFDLILADGSVYPYKGRLEYVDRQIDDRTGTIDVQVAFSNPGQVLRPGGYGNIRTIVRNQTDALTVPQRAVTDLQGRNIVAVVGDDNRVAIKQVKVGEKVGSLWIIEDGLKAGDQVVAEGTQKVREGIQVNAKAYPNEVTKAETANKTTY